MDIRTFSLSIIPLALAWSITRWNSARLVGAFTFLKWAIYGIAISASNFIVYFSGQSTLRWLFLGLGVLCAGLAFYCTAYVATHLNDDRERSSN